MLRVIISLLIISSSCDGFIQPSSLSPNQQRNKMLQPRHFLQMATTDDGNEASGSRKSSSTKIRDKMKKLAKSIIVKPMEIVAPQSIAELLTDAAVSGVIKEINVNTATTTSTAAMNNGSSSISSNSGGGGGGSADDVVTQILEEEKEMQIDIAEALDNIALAKTTISDAFALAETEIQKAEDSLQQSKITLQACKTKVSKAIAIAEKAAIQTTKDRKQIILREDKENEKVDILTLAYEDIDYRSSEMSPPFINEDQCLIPGEAVVRVEKAADNSRRIFAGIDIMSSVDSVWDILTDYAHLQDVVPNLVVNEVVETYDGEADSLDYELHPDVSLEGENAAIESISTKLKGAKLKQVGGAKVVGINFSATVTLEVREWPKGIPFVDENEGYDGKIEKKRKLERYRFPRPFAISSLPTKDISMQSVADDDGEFRLYQGVWRMQPLPGCAPEGGAAMRLTYAVEISPRPYLPVAFVEGRISQDLCNNLIAIRDHVTPNPSR